MHITTYHIRCSDPRCAVVRAHPFPTARIAIGANNEACPITVQDLFSSIAITRDRYPMREQGPVIACCIGRPRAETREQRLCSAGGGNVWRQTRFQSSHYFAWCWKGSDQGENQRKDDELHGGRANEALCVSLESDYRAQLQPGTQRMGNVHFIAFQS